MDVFHDLYAVILAAGNSSRFGNTPKQLAKLDGKHLLDIVIDTAIQAGFSRPLLILGAYEKEIRSAGKLVNRCDVVINPAWQDGMSSSIRTAIASMKNGCDGAAFLLADEPLIAPALLTAMASQFVREKPDILYPVYNGKRGNPAIISAKLFAELSRSTGDRGGRVLFDREDLLISRFPVPDQSCLLDIDTAEDLKRLQMAVRTGNY